MTTVIIYALVALHSLSNLEAIQGSWKSPVSFEEYVDQMGRGMKAGPFEMQIASDMLRRPIRIFDETGQDLFANRSTNGVYTFYPQNNASDDPLPMVVTANEDGSKHIELLASNYSSNTTSNICFYEALAAAVSHPVEHVLVSLKHHANEDPTARNVFEDSLTEVFSQLRVGQTKRRGSLRTQGKRLKNKEEIFDDCTRLRNFGFRTTPTRTTAGSSSLTTKDIEFNLIECDGSDRLAKVRTIIGRENLRPTGERSNVAGRLQNKKNYMDGRSDDVNGHIIGS